MQTQLDPTELKHYPFNDPNGERNLSVAIGPRTPGLAFKFVCTDADTFGGLKKADTGSITAGGGIELTHSAWSM